jgi:hypothetical protein
VTTDRELLERCANLFDAESWRSDRYKTILADIRARLAQPEQEWVSVPREPTFEMMKAACPPGSAEAQDWGCMEIYRAMIAAAPSGKGE